MQEKKVQSSADVEALTDRPVCTAPAGTHPTERHHVERVAAPIDFIKEVAVGGVGGVVDLQLAARRPEGTEQIISSCFKLLQADNTTGRYIDLIAS